jgi:hypothetical protein
MESWLVVTKNVLASTHFDDTLDRGLSMFLVESMYTDSAIRQTQSAGTMNTVWNVPCEKNGGISQLLHTLVSSVIMKNER